MREFLRHFRIHFWTFLFTSLIFIILRNSVLGAHDVVPVEQFYLPQQYYWVFYFLIIVLLSTFIAFILSLADIFIIGRIIYRKPFFVLAISGLIINLTVLSIVIFMLNRLSQIMFSAFSDGTSVVPEFREIAISSLVMVVAIVLSRLFIEIDRKLGPGNLWKFISGKFYNPREENRIFMFIDLKGSTTIAEKLGHYKFSQLLRDCFNDLSVVDKYHAEVYQYVGDEVVLSWPISRSKNYEQFLSAFFAFQATLNTNERHYLDEYGLVPQFKAGVHEGPVIVTEVGEIKREITYHGDTLNTTSRIQEKCNELEARLLVSEKLYNIIKPYSPYNFQDVGQIKLKGKQEEIRLYRVSL